jgi:hypothetical protein
MTNCTKYKVIRFPSLDVTQSKTIEDWLNSVYEYERLTLVAVVGDKYIFTRNAYMISMEKVKETK